MSAEHPPRGRSDRAPLGGRARPAAGVPGRAERPPPAPRLSPPPLAAGPPHSSTGSPWGRGRPGSPGGVTALAAPARLKIVQVRVRSRRALCHLCPLGTGRPERGARWGWHGAEGAARGRGGTSGGMFGVPRGAQAEFAAPSPGPRGVTGQVLPSREDKGDRPAPRICPLRPHPCSQPSRREVGDRPGGPAPPGCPRGGIRDIACERAPARPGRAARSLAVTLWVGGRGNGF